MSGSGGVKLSIGSPVVTMLPGGHGAWEATATIEDLARVAAAADRLGYHHLTCSEHIGVPVAERDRRGVRYWDPLATFGYLAARTERIRFATLVLVLGYHHPLEIAKRYGTLDAVSGGRLILGVGVGSLEEEFDLLGAPFADRGARADDALRALRAALSQPEPSLPRRVLRLRRPRRGALRGAGAGAPVGRRPHPALAPAGGGPGRRLEPLRREAGAGPGVAEPASSSPPGSRSSSSRSPAWTRSATRVGPRRSWPRRPLWGPRPSSCASAPTAWRSTWSAWRPWPSCTGSPAEPFSGARRRGRPMSGRRGRRRRRGRSC